MKAIENYTKAIGIYSHLIKLDCHNQDPAFYGNRAACYLQLKKYYQALEDSEAALRLEPDNPKNMRRKALALLHTGKLTEAQGIFQRILQIDATDKVILEDCKRVNLIYQFY